MYCKEKFPGLNCPSNYSKIWVRSPAPRKPHLNKVNGPYRRWTFDLIFWTFLITYWWNALPSSLLSPDRSQINQNNLNMAESAIRSRRGFVELGKILELSQCCYRTISFCMLSKLTFPHREGKLFKNYPTTDQCDDKLARLGFFTYRAPFRRNCCLFCEVDPDHISRVFHCSVNQWLLLPI